MAGKIDKLSYEEALEELKQIVARLNEGKVRDGSEDYKASV